MEVPYKNKMRNIITSVDDLATPKAKMTLATKLTYNICAMKYTNQLRKYGPSLMPIILILSHVFDYFSSTAH